jgi:hypothetical protein
MQYLIGVGLDTKEKLPDLIRAFYYEYLDCHYKLTTGVSLFQRDEQISIASCETDMTDFNKKQIKLL